MVMELMNNKFDLEEQNIKTYQKIQELKRNRLQNIKQIDMLDNRIRKHFDRKEIKHSEIR